MSKFIQFLYHKKAFLAQQTWMVPACFGLSCVLTVSGVILLALRGFEGVHPEWMFSMGADIFCMAICTMLCFSQTLNRKNRSEDTYVFVTLLTSCALALFLDQASWLVQGNAALRYVNLTVNVLFYMLGSILIYLFWKYIRGALKLYDLPMQIADLFVTAMLFPSLLLCLINFFYPLFFEVSAEGVYQRAAQWDVSQVYLSITLAVVLVAITFAKASRKERLVAISFIAIPLLNQLLTSASFGLSTQYAAMTVSIVLIYGVLFADREKTLASTEMELGVAAKIQVDMLPRSFPFLPERPEFDLYASMTPAKEVGGDFYDFFMVDDGHLALVMADVSGKGIPAALYMMSSKILIKNTVMTGKSPGEVLKAVNRELCQNHEQEMFVTVWLGILNLFDGTLVSANAGHEYPILKTPDGDFELIKSKHGFVLGGFPGLKYKETVTQLQPGSKLFLYTDGVPEAENETHEQYGFDRFLHTLNKNRDDTPENLLAAVRNNVKHFTQDHAQFDDLTMLCVHYRGSNMKELTIDAAVENIALVTDFVTEELEKMNCPLKAQTQIAVAIDELFGNIANYAYTPDIGKATVRVTFEQEPLSVIITFIDNGKPFNPLEQSDPDIHASIDERKQGGLGIFLVKKTMDMVEYECVDGQNILKIKKNLE